MGLDLGISTVPASALEVRLEVFASCRSLGLRGARSGPGHAVRGRFVCFGSPDFAGRTSAGGTVIRGDRIPTGRIAGRFGPPDSPGYPAYQEKSKLGCY